MISLATTVVARVDGSETRLGEAVDRPTILVRFPLLVDPDRNLYDSLDLPRRWWVGLNPKGWWNYARAIARGNGQGRIIEPNQLPGLAILDSSATVRYMHRGRALGDYPKLDRVLGELERVAAPAEAASRTGK